MNVSDREVSLPSVFQAEVCSSVPQVLPVYVLCRYLGLRYTAYHDVCSRGESGPGTRVCAPVPKLPRDVSWGLPAWQIRPE